jgi:hypothetical protein
MRGNWLKQGTGGVSAGSKVIVFREVRQGEGGVIRTSLIALALFVGREPDVH